jgi:hypothetical protein
MLAATPLARAGTTALAGSTMQTAVEFWREVSCCLEPRPTRAAIHGRGLYRWRPEFTIAIARGGGLSEDRRRWRVTLYGVDNRNTDFDSVANMTMLNGFVEKHSDLSLSYERHGREIIVSLNVTAAGEDEATTLGRSLLLHTVPPTPETTITRFETLPLKAEPDFT